MTYRELELFIQGREEDRKWIRRLLAWLQVNLINIQIPKGKPRLKIEQLLPREERQAASEEDFSKLSSIGGRQSKEDTIKRLQKASQEARQKKEQREWDEFVSSPEGKRYVDMVGSEE